MNERIDVNKVLEGLAEANAIDEYGNAGVRIEACMRQQQAEIEALKDIMVVAIKSGDWVVDGACDPDQYIGDRL